MVRQLRSWTIFIGIICASVMWGCSSQRPETNTIQTAVGVSPSGIVPQTASPADTPTAIPGTATFVPTPTVVPTLSEIEAQQYVSELLETNGGCKLPCFWGIEPGKSTEEEAVTMLQQLSPLGKPEIFSSGARVINIEPTLFAQSDEIIIDPDVSEDMVVSFHFGDKLVKDYGFEAKALKGSYVYDYEPFGERLARFRLPNVLADMGIPGGVGITTTKDNITRNGKQLIGGFSVYLFYPEQGFFIHYTTQARVVGKMVRGCLADASIEIHAYPPGNASQFSDLLRFTGGEGRWPLFDSGFYRSIETAMEMTPEQFYEKYSNPENDCMETAAELWNEADK